MKYGNTVEFSVLWDLCSYVPVNLVTSDCECFLWYLCSGQFFWFGMGIPNFEILDPPVLYIGPRRGGDSPTLRTH
jgi:hypothetical protein